MDTTDAYIEMRVAAIPDLGYGEPSNPCFDGAYHLAKEVYVDDKGDVYAYFKGDSPEVQLERQDQLQEMIAPVLSEKHGISVTPMLTLGFLVQWLGEQAKADGSTSMEQLWLAFVMKEKDGKVWTGTEWKEDTDGETHKAQGERQHFGEGRQDLRLHG